MKRPITLDLCLFSGGNMNIGLFIGGIGSAGTISEQINSLVSAEKEGFDSRHGI